MNNTEWSDKVIEVSVGDDIILAQAVAASLAAEGIETELVLSSDPYVGLDHTSPHRLMIRGSDVDAARPIIESHVQDAMVEQPAGAGIRGTRGLVGFGLLIVVAGGPLIVLVMVVRELLG